MCELQPFNFTFFFFFFLCRQSSTGSQGYEPLFLPNIGTSMYPPTPIRPPPNKDIYFVTKNSAKTTKTTPCVQMRTNRANTYTSYQKTKTYFVRTLPKTTRVSPKQIWRGVCPSILFRKDNPLWKQCSPWVFVACGCLTPASHDLRNRVYFQEHRFHCRYSLLVHKCKFRNCHVKWNKTARSFCTVDDTTVKKERNLFVSRFGIM